ncbi:MAG: hypothetical protein AB7S74_15570 [Hyphomicrobium sp.]
MSNTDWNESDLSSNAANFDPAEGQGCHAADLKELLNTIVSQITEADRRQADTLNQLQERLSTMGRDARSLRDKVPDKYQLAFERIEAGMAELAARISESGPSYPAANVETDYHHATQPFGPATTETRAFQDEPAMASAPQTIAEAANASEPPMALRSALANSTAWRREENTHKPMHDVDTFDVIESLPGDVTNPWDDDSAEALASVYDKEPDAFPQDAYSSSAGETTRNYPSSDALGSASVADHGWLEKRFAEISKQIETSIAEIRPDESFFALGQRLDQFERSVTQAFENVASQSDFEAMRQLENHMIAIVEHLESSQGQLSRIESIEAQLADIGARLDAIHALADSAAPAYAGDMGEHGGNMDVTAIAKAAADETAARLSEFAQNAGDGSGIHDLRGLLEQSMSNARQSEENTNALLDTLQQAMIRLLDRMDAVEYNQHQAASQLAQPAFQQAPERAFHTEDPYTRQMPDPEPEFDDYPHAESLNDVRRDPDPIGLDEAVAAVAAKTSMRAPRHQVSDSEGDDLAPAKPERSEPEKLRQDFIADARRARMRLAAEAGDDELEVSAPLAAIPREPIAPAPAKAARASKPATTTVSDAPAKKASAISPRVVALSIALAIASGAYLFNPFAKSGVPTGNPGAMMNQTSAPTAPAGDNTAAKANKGNAGADAPPPEADFGTPEKRSQLNLHQMYGSAPASTLAMSGVALAHPATSADAIERSRREQAMASISTRLGQAAAENPAIVSPTALDLAAVPRNDNVADQIDSGHRSALDMPPAMVGPLSLRLAAANGDPSAEFEVGARIAEGKGPDQNFKEAAKWYMRSASKGFAQAQYRLGTLYERGLGMKPDEARAKEWYARAAGQGNIKAMHNLAVLSANGKTGSPDYTIAARYFKDAAARGLSDSQFNLAVLYENGLGVPADMREAYKWLSLAARHGDKEALRRRDIMKGKLTAAELKAAEKMAAGFRPLPTDPLINDARTAGEAWKKNSSDQG